MEGSSQRRKVIVLSSDDYSKNIHIQDILIAKIVTIKSNHREQNWYKLLIEDKHPLFVHLPEGITGEESYVNLAQVTSIGKKMLINKRLLLPEDRMQLVENRLNDFIDLGVIKSDSVIVNE